jgi:cell division protease FtsH
MDNARTILSEKKELLHKLAVSLIEKETLNASEIEAIIGTA